MIEVIIGIAIIYGIIRLIIFIFPYVAIALLIILGVGCGIGILVGIFYGIKSYIISINKNITSKTFKSIMISITYAFIIIILLYIIAITYYLTSYYLS